MRVQPSSQVNLVTANHAYSCKCQQEISFSLCRKMKMNASAVILVVLAACLTLKAVESTLTSSNLLPMFSKPAERAARSIQPRQANAVGSCTSRQLVNIYAGYPSDCTRVLQSAAGANLTDPRVTARLYTTLCQPRCNRAVTRFYFECGFESFGELFIQLCSTNSNNARCYNLIGTLDSDATRVQSSCPTGGSSSCSSSCQSAILTFRNNLGCCVNVFNTSALTDFVAADDYCLWASCSVETPGFCTQSTVNRPNGVLPRTQGTANCPGSVSGTTSTQSTVNRPDSISSTTSTQSRVNRPGSASGTTTTQHPLSKLLAVLLLLSVVMVITF